MKKEPEHKAFQSTISENVLESIKEVSELKRQVLDNNVKSSGMKAGKNLKTSMKTAFEVLDFSMELIPEYEMENDLHNNKNLFTEQVTSRNIFSDIEKSKKKKVDEFARLNKDIVLNKDWGDTGASQGLRYNNSIRMPLKTSVLKEVGQNILGFSDLKKSVIFDKLNVKYKIAKNVKPPFIKTENELFKNI